MALARLLSPAALDLLEVLAIGLPFCAFKLLVGLHYGGAGGIALGALGAVDLAINAANAAALLLWRRRLWSACAFAALARAARGAARPAALREDVGNSLDVLLSFSLVAWMIARGAISELPAFQRVLWNVGVILNVLGAGLGRFGLSLRNLSKA